MSALEEIESIESEVQSKESEVEENEQELVCKPAFSGVLEAAQDFNSSK